LFGILREIEVITGIANKVILLYLQTQALDEIITILAVINGNRN
jgi:hypothetical protein